MPTDSVYKASNCVNHSFGVLERSDSAKHINSHLFSNELSHLVHFVRIISTRDNWVTPTQGSTQGGTGMGVFFRYWMTNFWLFEEKFLLRLLPSKVKGSPSRKIFWSLFAVTTSGLYMPEGVSILFVRVFNSSKSRENNTKTCQEDDFNTKNKIFLRKKHTKKFNWKYLVVICSSQAWVPPATWDLIA